MTEAVEAATDLLHLAGHAAVLCPAQQFPICHRLFAAAPSMQNDVMFSSSSSGSKGMFMASDAPFTLVDHPSQCCNSNFEEMFLSFQVSKNRPAPGKRL